MLEAFVSGHNNLTIDDQKPVIHHTSNWSPAEETLLDLIEQKIAIIEEKCADGSVKKKKRWGLDLGENSFPGEAWNAKESEID